MKLPVVEQITRKIAARLRTVEAGNGYAVTVSEIVRPPRRPQWTPAHGVTVLRLTAFEAGTEETDTRGVKLFRTGVWEIDHYLEPSDTDGRPLDLLQAIAIAELERALAEDFYFDAAGTFAGAGGFAGLGHHAELRPPQMVTAEDGSAAAVRITLAVGYAHSDRDPYTALP